MYIPKENNVTPPTLDYYLDARDGFLGDPASELAALLIDHLRESRQNYLEQSRAQEHQLRKVQAAKIEAMRDEADKIRDAGMAKGAGMIASGLLTIGASGVKAHTATTNAAASDAAPTSPETAPTDWEGILKGAASGAQGGGELFAAGDERQAQLARTRATEDEHLAGEAERRLKLLDDARANARDLERTAFEHLRKKNETAAATDQTLVTWRG